MLEVDEDSRLGREVLKRGARYRADLVPSDDAIARMYESAIERLEQGGLSQYEISNFARARIRVDAQSALLAATAVSWRRSGCVIDGIASGSLSERHRRRRQKRPTCCAPRRPTI